MSSGRIVGLNGQLVSEEAARVSVFDHGFLYGAGFFATIRWEKDRVFHWGWHVERLQRSCASLNIRWEVNAAQLFTHVANVCRANGLLEQAYVRISVSAGEAPLGLYTGIYQNPQTIVIAQPLPEQLLKPIAERAMKTLQVVPLPRSSKEGEERFKSFQYLNLLNGKRAILNAGTSAMDVEGLMLDGHGSLCEGLVSNLFFRKENTWYTPSLDTGCLPGVTRRWMVATLRDQGVSLQEGHFGMNKLAEADEVFVCNAVQQIVPIKQLNDESGKVIRVWDGAGEATKWLIAAFEQAYLK